MKDLKKVIACAIGSAVLILAIFCGKKLLTEMHELTDYLRGLDEDCDIL